MDCFYISRSVLSCIILWSVAIFRTLDGSNITWYEPPPSETVANPTITSTTSKNLTKGFLNEELSCSFNFTADMSLVAVSFELGSNTLASYYQSQSSVNSFDSRFNATWVPTKLTLIVFDVTSDDKGEYVCRVQFFSGGLKSWLRNIAVDVLVQSQIIEISGKTVIEGGNVTMECLPEGNPPPSFTWTRLSDNSVVTMPLINVRRQDEGEYRCIADNGVGKPANETVRLIVQYPPKDDGSGQNATVAGGVEHTFSCPVDGNPVPSITWYSKSGAHSGKQFKTRQNGCYTCVARNIHGISDNITQCLIINSSLPTVPLKTDRSQTMVSSITVSQNPSQVMVSSTTASQSPRSSSTSAPKAGPPWIIIIPVAGGVLLLAVLVGFLTWWVHKRRKCRKDSQIHNSNQARHDDEGGYSQVQGAYAQSGPPAASGTDGTIGQEIEVAAAIPTYAVVDKSNKKKNKKLREEVPPVYAEVNKSKKKKKKVDDKNLYETLDEPKKARKPGELLYADLGDFQNPGMSPVSISPQPLPAIKIPEPYERTDYADITQFHKGNAKLPQNDGNEDTEMKPKRLSKKKIEGNDNETPI